MCTSDPQRGNALFLILIAVILFAALSYAITQSNRSGADPARETSLVASTSVTQYPATISTSIARMMLRGVSVLQLDFDPPSSGTFNAAPTNVKVFHPNGGGVSFQNVDPNTVELDGSGVPMGQWAFVHAGVTDIGTNGSVPEDQDIVAILTYVRKGICERINEQITGSTAIPDNAEAGIPMSDYLILSGGPGKIGVTGQPFMCVYSPNSDAYAYYHVLVER